MWLAKCDVVIKIWALVDRPEFIQQILVDNVSSHLSLPETVLFFQCLLNFMSLFILKSALVLTLQYTVVLIVAGFLYAGHCSRPLSCPWIRTLGVRFQRSHVAGLQVSVLV